MPLVVAEEIIRLQIDENVRVELVSKPKTLHEKLGSELRIPIKWTPKTDIVQGN